MNGISSITVNIERQGSLVKIKGAPMPHHGCRGNRGKQCGHTPKAARRLEDFLLRRHPATAVLFLTFSEVVGPEDAVRKTKAFMKKLERKVKAPVSAVVKLEPQQRLSAEITILFWGVTLGTLAALPLEELWEKTLKCPGRILLQEVKDWDKLASYVAKPVSLEGGKARVGNKKTATLSKGYKIDAFSASESDRSLNVYTIRQAWSEWLSYNGHYSLKLRKGDIPVQPLRTEYVSAEIVSELRAKVNARRKNHFVGADEPFLLRGTLARESVGLLPSSLRYTEECSSSPLQAAVSTVAGSSSSNAVASDPLDRGNASSCPTPSPLGSINTREHQAGAPRQDRTPTAMVPVGAMRHGSCFMNPGPIAPTSPSAAMGSSCRGDKGIPPRLSTPTEPVYAQVVEMAAPSRLPSATESSYTREPLGASGRSRHGAEPRGRTPPVPTMSG